MGHPIICDFMYGGGVSYSKESLLAVENAPHPERLPIPFEHQATGQVYDLGEPGVLEVVSPAIGGMRQEQEQEQELKHGGGGVGVGSTGGGGWQEHVRVPDEGAVLCRCALHSASLKFKHPSTAEELTITAPLQTDMAEVVAILRANREKREDASRTALLAPCRRCTFRPV
jgi:threonine dehydrogenase-like Zn-dependent dehydrogenase